MTKGVWALVLLAACKVTQVDSTQKPPQENIVYVAANSKCAQYNFKSRGKAPVAFIKGMALSFAKASCFPNALTVGSLGGKNDALVHYDAEFKSIGLGSDSDAKRLNRVFTLLVGLGLRESSGRHCTGRDRSAANLDPSTAESGAFQVSQNSVNFSPILKNMINPPHNNCLLEVFSDGVSCSELDKINHGTGPGFEFQKLMKTCPNLSVDYVGALLRLSGGSLSHFGPIRRKEAEVVSACSDLFYYISQIVAANPKICGEFQ